MDLRALERTIIVGVVCALALVGCSSDGAEASTCADLQNLATQVEALGDVDVAKTGIDGLQEQTDKIDAAWKQAKESGDEQFGSELDAVDDSLKALGSTLTGVVDGASSITELPSQMKTDIDQLSTSWDALRSAVESELGDCDLPSPTN